MSQEFIMPCPFCGSRAILVRERPELPNGRLDTLYMVRCTLRECGNRTAGWFPSPPAVAAWNKRTPTDAADAAVRRKALLDASTEVAGHWNVRYTPVDQYEQAQRSASELQKMAMEGR